MGNIKSVGYFHRITVTSRARARGAPTDTGGAGGGIKPGEMGREEER